MGRTMAPRDNCRFSSIAHYKMKPSRFQQGLEDLEAEAISRTGLGLRRLGQLSYRGLQWAVRTLEAKAPRRYAALVAWLERKGYLDQPGEGHPALPARRVAVPRLPAGTIRKPPIEDQLNLF